MKSQTGFECKKRPVSLAKRPKKKKRYLTRLIFNLLEDRALLEQSIALPRRRQRYFDKICNNALLFLSKRSEKEKKKIKKKL